MSLNKMAAVMITIFFCFSFIGLTTAFNLGVEQIDEYEKNHYSMLMDIPPNKENSLSRLNPDPQPTITSDDLPSQFSWTNYNGNWMTPVEDNGECASGWAIVALGAFEAAINIASGNPDLDIELSEQYVLSCLSDSGSCYGGWMSDAITLIQSTDPGPSGNGINGCTVESCMPYQGDDTIPCSDKCQDWDYHTDPPQEDNKLWQIESYGVSTFSEDSEQDWNIMKSWIIEHGPIVADLYASSDFINWGLQHHSSSDVYQMDDDGMTNIGVVICGWKDDANVLNGGYWIIKNKWGTGWGYGGYANIAYGCNSLGTRDVTWIEAEEWENGGITPFDRQVIPDFEMNPIYPHPGDIITFTDISKGEAVMHEWDFNGDGIIDSTKENPTWTYDIEDTFNITYSVVSKWGFRNTLSDSIEVRSIWPPKAKINPSDIVDNELEYTFDARYSTDRDGGTIVSYQWDFDDGTTAKGSTVTHSFSKPDKQYDVTLSIIDDDGASESTVCTVKIDQSVPPVTTITHGIGDKTKEWYNNIQRITFGASDWSEVIETYYRVNDGEWKQITSGECIYLASEGQYTIDAYSVDYYGNEEIPVTETFGIDKDAPSISAATTGEKENGWFTSPTTVSLTASDDFSGLDSIMYKIDNSGWKIYTDSFTVDDGRHHIWAVASDNAGNIVEEKLIVNVDSSPPMADCSYNGEGSNNKFFRSVNVCVYGVDKGSGVDSVFYRLEGADFKEYTKPIEVNTIGEHTIEFYAVDILGNKGKTESETFIVSPVNFEMMLDKPRSNLYLFGLELFTLKNPIIIGPMEVIVTLDSFTTHPPLVDHVEFYLDGQSMEIDTSTPFTWRMEGSFYGSHSLRVEAVTTTDFSETERIISENVDVICIIP